METRCILCGRPTMDGISPIRSSITGLGFYPCHNFTCPSSGVKYQPASVCISCISTIEYAIESRRNEYDVVGYVKEET